MSCSGNPYLSTPAMDGLAERGVRFENAYCALPVCGPARGSLLTGRMPHATGVQWNGQTLGEGVPTLGSLFRGAEYSTLWAGKWHLGESYPLKKGSGQTQIQDFELLPFFDSNVGYPEWGYGDMTDEPLAEATAKFLREQGARGPFASGVSFCKPHDCCYLTRRPERYRSAEKIAGPLPPLPANFEVDPNEPEFLRQRRYTIDHYGDEVRLSKDWGVAEWQAYLWNYYRMTERVDQALGRVFQALDDSGLRENTLVIFTSDHGDGVASHRWTAKLNFYEEATRIPFIVSWPGVIPEGKVDRARLVSQIDVLPTFLDYAGIGPPAGIDGRSLRDAFEKPESAWREYLVTELADDNRDQARKGRMVRTAQYKYCLYSHGERNEQLFDLRYDPGETQNLAAEPALGGVKQQLREKLSEWMAQTGDEFPALRASEPQPA